MDHRKVDGLWARAVPVLAAVTLQVALTPVILGQPIRISLADPAVPLAMLAVLIVTVGTTGWKNMADFVLPPWLWIGWAVLTTGWLTISLLHGRAELGEWSGWALRNKYMGWYALLFFLLAGFACARLLRDFASRFLVAFVGAGAVIAAGTLVAFVLTQWVVVPKGFLFGPDARAVGLMGNANAFGFMVAVILCLQLSGLLPRPGPAWLRWIVPVVLLAALVLSGSRSSWLAAAVGVGLLILYRQLDWRALLVAIVAGGLIVAAIGTIEPRQAGVGESPVPAEIYVSVDDLLGASQHGVSQRLAQIQQGYALWLTDPIQGAGLGAYLELERQMGLLHPQQIHNSYMWLLAETGIPGFVLVVGFFVFVALRLHRARPSDPVLKLGVMVLAVFAAMALFQEALYQRHIWFVAGLMLALSTKPAEPSS